MSIWLLCSPVLLSAAWKPWLTAVILLFLLTLRLTTKRWTGRLFSPTLLDPLIAIYLFLAGIAMWISPVPAQSIVNFVTLLAGAFGYYATVDWLVTPARRRRLLVALAVGGGAIASLGFLTLEWPSRQIINLQFITDTLPHLGGHFSIHHNEMAGVILLLLPIALFLPRQGSQKYERALLAGTAVFMMIMLLFTQSRNAWVALLISLLAYKLWGRFRTRYMLLLLFLWMLLPFGLVMLPTAQQQTVAQQIALLDEVTKGNSAAGQSWASRLEIWSAAKQAIGDYPVLGTGWYAFDSVSRLNDVYTVTLPTFPISHAHNLLLQTAVNTGIVGLITAVFLWLTTMTHLWRRPDENDLEITAVMEITAVLGASFTAYLCFSAFDILAWEQRSGIIIWLLLAAAMTAVPVKKPLPKALPFAPIALWLLLLFTPLLSRNVANIQLDKARLADGASPVNINALAHDDRRTGIGYWLMGEQGQALAAWQADNDASQFLLGQGQQAYVDGDWQTAVSWHTAALIIDPMDGFAYYERGLAHEAAQMPALALADYEQATALISSVNPVQQAEAWEGAGQMFVYFDDWKSAALAFMQANKLVPDHPDYQQQLQDVNQMLQEMDGQP